MSLEQKIEALTAALVANTAALLASQQAVQVVPQAVAPAPVAAAPAFVPAAVGAFPNVAPLEQPAPAAAMPPLPSFAAPVAPAPAAVPFNDGKGLIEFVMNAYKELGPDKGAQIQNVLVSLGVQNVNDVKPEQYPAFYSGVQALKA